MAIAAAELRTHGQDLARTEHLGLGLGILMSVDSVTVDDSHDPTVVSYDDIDRVTHGKMVDDSVRVVVFPHPEVSSAYKAS